MRRVLFLHPPAVRAHKSFAGLARKAYVQDIAHEPASVIKDYAGEEPEFFRGCLQGEIAGEI